MRKISALLLAILIGLTFCLPGIAADSTTGWVQMVGGSPAMTSGEPGRIIISEEKARESLADMFSEIISGKDLQAEYSEQSFMGKACWQFQSRNIKHQPGLLGLEIDARVDAVTGEVVQMNYNPMPEVYKGKNVKIVREQALQIAQEFLKKVQPDKLSRLTISNTNQRFYYDGNVYNKYYMFSWNRIANGVKVDSDNIYIGVDAVTGMVSHYTYTWHDCQFPQLENTISRQELTAKLLNESGLYPSYMGAVGANGNDSNPLMPAYILNSSAAYYDCRTGQGLGGDGSPIAPQDIHAYEQVFVPKPDVNSNETNLSILKKVSPEVAKKAAEDFFQFMGLSGDIRRSGGGKSVGDGFSQEFWTFSISSGNSYRDMNNTQVGVDIYTGKIVQYNHFNNQAGDIGKSISNEEALNKAVEVIQKINPEKKNLVALQKQAWSGNDDETYGFNFARLVNGIPCEQEGIRLEIDKSGQLISYWVTWYDAQFASLINIISPEKAREIYRVQEPFELAYVFPMKNHQASGQDKDGQPMLVYRSLEKSRVNAISGELFGWGAKDPSSAVADSFAGHWAAPALSLLNENGLLPMEGIKPDGQMTRMQALKILVRTIGSQYSSDDQDIDLAFADVKGSDPDAKVLQKAVKEGILPNQGNFEPDKIMSREDLAVWLVNSLGFQDVATMKNRIETPFKDAAQIAPDKVNYVGMVEGLGLLAVDENDCFHPQDAVTWAEMANASARLATRTHAEY